jgi:hypothetical protein
MRLYAPTAGTRIAVWMFPAVTILLGLAYMGPTSRLQSVAYHTATGLLPMRWWGALFVTVGLVKVLSLVSGRQGLFVGAMCLGSGLYTWWGCLFICAVFADPSTSLAAPILPLSWAVSHIAALATIRNPPNSGSEDAGAKPADQTTDTR